VSRSRSRGRFGEVADEIRDANVDSAPEIRGSFVWYSRYSRLIRPKTLAISRRVAMPQGSLLSLPVRRTPRVSKKMLFLAPASGEINPASEIRPASARNSRPRASDGALFPSYFIFSPDDYSLHSVVPVYYERKYQYQSRARACARVSRISLASAARNASRPASHNRFGGASAR